jgi:hypothetical protein
MLLPPIDINERIAISPGTGPIPSVCDFENWVLVDAKENFWMQKEHVNARGRTDRIEP